MLQGYVSCEGRFATIFVYHMRFLVHTVGISKLNLPFYLLKILSKMATRVRNHPSHTSHNVFHHGLVKLLVLDELEKHNRTWSHFLFWLGFKLENPSTSKIQSSGTQG